MSSADNIKVAIKVRPLIQRERDQKCGVQWRIHGDTIECINPMNPNVKFSFDQICDENTTTQDLFVKVTKPIVESSVNGFNGTIFAYGQTSSGKTHTMLGTADQPGLTILAVREIFDNMKKNADRSYLLRVSYIEIYNERVFDLLDKRNELKIQESGSGDTTVNSVEKIVNSEQMIMDLLSQGNKERRVAETKMNVQSSRSHTIFSIIIESQDRSGIDESDAAVQISVLNLVDLAGSERADATGATGSRLKEGAHINKSLLSLSLVINKLSEDPEQSKHINYRDSKLTRILQPSLGGNALTAIICTITPAVVEETNYTLGFANRAKKIKNKPIVNEVLSDAVMIKRMHKQIAGLEKQLTSEREKCRKIETSLFQRKDQIIGGRGKSSLNRRRTWAPTASQDENGEARPRTPLAERLLGSSVFGHQIEYTEEQFNSILDSSFSSICPAPSMYNTGTPIGRNLPPRTGISLLKTPKSFLKRHPLVSATSAASPVNTYDKDKKIEALENELEELQQFQKLESEDFESRFAEKTSQIDLLTQRIHELEQMNKQLESTGSEIEALLKTEVAKCEQMESKLKESSEYRSATEQRMKKIEADMKEAAKAKTLAECNFSSIEFEYEQYKSKSKARERELVQQIDEKTFENQIKLLNAKVTELVNSRKQLEVTVWETEAKLKTSMAESSGKDEQIDRLTKDNLALKAQMVDGQKHLSAAAKLDQLQKEYDDLSNQLMDRIHENDDAMKNHALIVAELTQSIDTLKLNLAEEETRAQMLSNELSTLRNDLRYKNGQLEAANDNTTSEREQFNREIESLKTSLSQCEEQLKNHQSNAAAEKTSFIDRLNAADADAKTILALEKERSEQLEKEIKLMKSDLDEVKTELENNKRIKSFVMDEQTNRGIDVLCILLQNTIGECDRLACESHKVRGRLSELNDKYEQTMGREKELSDVHTNAVNEHAITVANYEASLVQVNQDHSVAISTLETEIAELNKQLIVKCTEQRSTETQTEQCRCEELEREKGMLDDICNKSRITIQFAVNELAILRHSYAELEMSFAKQELHNLKLQKTISDNDDDFVEDSSVFASTMASTTTIANDTLMADCSVVQREDDKQATAASNAKTRDLNETCVTHENDWRRLNECLLDASTADDIETLLAKVKQLKEKAAEHDRVLQIMITANASFGEYENIENAIIESQQRHLETSEQLLLVSNNYEILKEKFNVLQGESESFRDENDALKRSVSDSNAKITSIEEEISRQLAVNDKLRDEIASEQENVSKLREQIDVLGQQMNELEATRDGLAEENKTLSIRMVEKTAELDRLQRIVEEKLSVERELAKVEELRQEFDQIKNQLSLKECEVMALNAEKVALSAQLDDRNAQIERFEADRPKLAAAHETIEQLTGELESLKAQKIALEAEQARLQSEVGQQMARVHQLDDTVANGAKEKEDLCGQLAGMNRKMTEWELSKQNEVTEMLKMIECLTEKNHHLEAKNEKLKSDCATSMEKLKTDEEKFRQLAIDHSNLLESERENGAKFHQTIDQLKTKISVFEDEQEVLERENNTLTSTITTQKTQIVELQSKLSSIQAELSSIKRDLATKVAECKMLETESGEAERLRANIETMKLKVQSANDKKAEFEHKCQQFTETINKQRSEIDQLGKAVASGEQSRLIADKELQSVRQELSKKCAEHRALTEKVEQLEVVAQQAKMAAPVGKQLPGDGKTVNKGHNTSVDVDNLLRENHNLKTSTQRLMDELEDFRATTRQTRKSKRHSTHDDTRRISGFNSNLIDIEVQTEPTSELCRCNEFNATIVQLRRDIVIKDAKFNTFKMHTGVDALKRENAELHLTLSTMRTELNQQRTEHQRIAEKYERAKRKLGELLAIEADKPIFSHASTQTITEDGDEITAGGSYVFQMNVYKLQEKYQASKKSFLQLKEMYDALKVEHERSKEVADMVKRKYDQLKTLCLYRQTEIDRIQKVEAELQKKMEKTKSELDILKVKYASAKLVIHHRGNELAKYDKAYSFPDENVPANGNCGQTNSEAGAKR